MSALKFHCYCGQCFANIAPNSGIVLSCGDYLCNNCCQINCKTCPVCCTSGVKAANLSNPPDEVSKNMADPCNYLENIFVVLKFQMSHYKETLNRASMKLSSTRKKELEYERRIVELEALLESTKRQRTHHDPQTYRYEVPRTPPAYERPTNQGILPENFLTREGFLSESILSPQLAPLEPYCPRNNEYESQYTSRNSTPEAPQTNSLSGGTIKSSTKMVIPNLVRAPMTPTVSQVAERPNPNKFPVTAPSTPLGPSKQAPALKQNSLMLSPMRPLSSNQSQGNPPVSYPSPTNALLRYKQTNAPTSPFNSPSSAKYTQSVEKRSPFQMFTLRK